MCVTAVSAGCKFPIYCCPVNFKTAEKSNPKPFSIGLRAFFFKDQAPESQIMMVGFAAGGRTRAEWACPKRVVQRRRVSLSCGRKTSLCSSYFPYQPQGAGRRANVSRLGGTASLGPVPIGRDQAKSRWFSKSKSICVGGLGKVPRLCAIWTPQCGGMKGKLCFIKRKNRSLVSNGRIFREKNASFFEGMERVNENLWTFFRNVPSFLFFLPAFFEKTPVPSPTMTLAVSSSAPPYARTDTPLRIAHSASSQFLPSPFTFTRNSLIQCVLRVKEMLFFRLHR